MRTRADIAHSRLGGLLHYIAQFAGEHELALTLHERRLDVENLPAHFGPCQAHRRADFVLLFRLQVAEFRHTEKFGNVLGVNGDGDFLLGILHRPPGHFAADIADLPLQIPYARLARVLLDDPHQALTGEGELLFGET